MADEGVGIFVTFAQSITFESIDFVIGMIYELNSSRQTSHHSCGYFKINRFDQLSSTKIRGLPQALA